MTMYSRLMLLNHYFDLTINGAPAELNPCG
ncbi:hypothetical protein D781_3721 [Serratia sp. FGI94]|nr:hypothetical protein D781_3721 [Serratia sp. FGI94]